MITRHDVWHDGYAENNFIRSNMLNNYDFVYTLHKQTYQVINLIYYDQDTHVWKTIVQNRVYDMYFILENKIYIGDIYRQTECSQE